MSAQPDSPAHTVGGACQTPAKPGGFTEGIVWCCPICKGFWYATKHEWKYLPGSRPTDSRTCGCRGIEQQVCDECQDSPVHLHDYDPSCVESLVGECVLDRIEAKVGNVEAGRHPKWQRVEPGTLIPAGQPYMIEYDEPLRGLTRNTTRAEYVQPDRDTIAGHPYFIDSSWKPPLVLPTAACVIRAKVKGPVTHRVLFGHPNPGEDGMTFCRAVDGLRYGADEIESFEVLWMDDKDD